MDPLISVIIINHNYDQYLEKCITSVLEQNYPNVEVILVDDGSTDFSNEIIKKYEDLLTAKFLGPSAQGPSEARNIGISICRGDYIAFLDADDYWLPDKLAVQMSYIEENNIAGVYSTTHLQNLSTGTSLVTDNPELTFESYVLKPLGVGGYLMSTLLLSADVIRCVGGFNRYLRHGEDYDIGSRIFAQFQIDCIERPLTYIRQHPGSLSQRYDTSFLVDMSVWSYLFLETFHNRLSLPLRIRYVTAVGVGAIKVVIKFKDIRGGSKFLLKWIDLFRFLK